MWIIKFYKVFNKIMFFEYIYLFGLEIVSIVCLYNVWVIFNLVKYLLLLIY